jgi:hypothetical protein
MKLKSQKSIAESKRYIGGGSEKKDRESKWDERRAAEKSSSKRVEIVLNAEN